MSISRLEMSQTTMFHGEFADRKKEFSEACEWLTTEMGFPYKNTRMGDYERLMKTFFDSKSASHADEELMSVFYEFMQASTEACQIIRLWNTFKEGTHNGLKERIKHVMSGKSIRAEAIKKNSNGQSDDPARDFAFELNIASRFLKGGYEVDLSDACDVVVNINKNKLFVECKRIKSLKKLGQRIKEASKQIDVRIGSNRQNKFGLIAVDVTDIILPEGSVTVTSDARFYDLEIKTKITNFARDYQDIAVRNIGRNVSGVLFEFSSCAFLSGKDKLPSLGFGRSACMYRHVGMGKKSLSVVNDFIDKIANQNL